MAEITENPEVPIVSPASESNEERVENNDGKPAEPLYNLQTKLVLLFVALLIPPMLVVVYAFKPTEASWFPKCTWYQLTGTHCPGCGGSRALHALLHGDFRQALAYNIPIFIYIPLFSYWAFRVAVGYFRNEMVSVRRTPPWLIKLFFFALMSYWILRNIPVYPFTLLAPHQI